LWRGRRLVKLQDNPRQVLLALLERPGELVHRDALRRRLWHDHTFVDFDNGLNVCIRKLREALGDDAPTPRFVETVRGQGYRFVAPVRMLHANGHPLPAARLTAAPLPVAEVASPPQFRRWQRVVATVAIAAAAGGLVSFIGASADSALNTLAVLPLSNQTGDVQADLSIDGLSEALTTELASRVHASVIASPSTFSLRGDIGQLSTVADRLRADGVIVGSVSQTASGLAIAIRLVEADGNRVRWSGRFERASLADGTLAGDIVSEILANVGGVAAKPSPQTARTRDIRPAAHTAFLRGRFFWAKRGQANAIVATQYLSTAIELQPDYAEAWAGLADVYAVHTGAPSPVIVPWPGNAIDAGIIAARQALRLSPSLAEAHAALGKLFISQLRMREAEAELREAVRLNPNYSTARQWLGTLYMRLRRCDEARAQVEIGARLDPLSALVNEAVGSVYLHCGDPQRATEIVRHVLQLHPAAASSHIVLGRALTAAGRPAEAVTVMEPFVARGDQTFGTAALLKAYFDAGRMAQFQALAASATAPYLKAVIAALENDRSRMYAQLRNVVAGKDGSWLSSLLIEPAFAAVSTEPEFAEIAAAAGFPTPIRPIVGAPQTTGSR